MLPHLESAVDPETLERIGEELEVAKVTAPTRPHPGAPNEPPMNVVVNAATKPLDWVRDRLSKWGL
jgi:hypothetical protein